MLEFAASNFVLIEVMVCLACGAMILAPFKHKTYPVMALVIVSLAVPRRLFERPESALQPHPGIGSAYPTVVTSVFALVLAVAVLRWSHQQRKHALVGLVLLAGLACGVFFVWGSTPTHWSGYLTYVTALVAWLGGLAIGRQAAVDLAVQRYLTWLLVGVISAQLVISLMQVLGYGPLVVEASDQGLTRARGTFGHAGDVGKWLVAMVALLLPNLARPSRRDVVLLTYGGILAALVCIGLSASRANMAAIITLLLVWTFVAVDSLSRSHGRKLLLGAVIACVPFVGVYLLRFQADPEGGSRPRLLAAALRQLQRTPWSGTGLNSYVEVVGPHDAATARGLPVHNAFLLAAAEVGIPLFLVTMGVVGILSLRVARIHYLQRLSPHTGAYLALLCALVVIGVTGWGALKVTVLPGLAFTVAFLVGAVHTGRPPGAAASRVLTRRPSVAAPVAHG